ncbi:MAG: DNA-binding protein HRL53 [Phycisphaerae bacterium]|nr:DNA-binding protein HRL53 [Phycisphaerae bacterium]
MTKKDIVRTVSDRLGLNQALAKEAVEMVLTEIRRVICAEGRIELRNFGVFEIKKRAARKARNPRTNQEVAVPPRNVVSFTPGKLLMKMVREKPVSGPSGSSRHVAQ